MKGVLKMLKVLLVHEDKQRQKQDIICNIIKQGVLSLWYYGGQQQEQEQVGRRAPNKRGGTITVMPHEPVFPGRGVT